MDLKRSVTILEALAKGCSPETGELLENETILNDQEVKEALEFAVKKLKKPSKEKPWKKVDYFRKEKFNNLSPSAIQQLKDKVNQLQLQKIENLPDNLIEARKKHPRSHEPWSDEERTLLQKAIEYTNDLKLLSDCFGRSKEAVESCGKRIIYEKTYSTVGS